ncbi:MAG: hypothetical protein KGY76_06240 [Candidatus Thermoplasmatota archaeon]|nr:hypothetical protein [Candidatus Thermoplasmatota archaeon]
MTETKLPDNWDEIKNYRKKLWSEVWIKRGSILLVLWFLTGFMYLSFHININNLDFKISILLYTLGLIPGFIFFSYITWREWKEKKLLSGIFMILLFFVLAVIYSVPRKYMIYGMPILLIALMLYGFAPSDLIRIRLTRRKRDR